MIGTAAGNIQNKIFGTTAGNIQIRMFGTTAGNIQVERLVQQREIYKIE